MQGDSDSDLLFEIHRSVNRNRVVYRVVRDPENAGRLHAQTPVEAYWIDVEPETLAANAKRGLGARSELTALERRLAYGFDCASKDDGTATMTLRAIPQRELVVGIDGASDRAFAATMAGEPADLCTLRRVDVSVEHVAMGMLPRVRGINVSGRRVSDGRTVRESLDSGGRVVNVEID